MKICIKHLFHLPTLTVGLGLLLAGQVTANTFTILHSFTYINGPIGTNSDGTYPVGGLILSGNTLYGTAQNGGSSGSGTVFAVNTGGTGFTNLYSFSATDPDTGTNSDGANPKAGLLLSGNTLYGTTAAGGSGDAGAVFAVNPGGTGFTNLYSFPGANLNISLSVAGLILSGNTLYGTTEFGGSASFGSAFAVTTDGLVYTTLHDFVGTYGVPGGDAAEPVGGLILSGNTLYGTTEVGGATTSDGTVFAINTDLSGYAILYSFTRPAGSPPGPGINSDGYNPCGGLILSGNTLYGTAKQGGANGNGTVFAFNTANDGGMGFTNLYSFSATDADTGTNSDGANPYGGLVLSGNTLYGTARAGGTNGNGTVFAVNTDGTGFTNLHSFTAFINANYLTNSDGAVPIAGLILSGNTLYGTANQGGSSGFGTVFSLSLGTVTAPPPPKLTVIRSVANLIITWPTNATGFTLQSTTNLASPVWITVAGQFAVTNTISGTRKFYRLLK